MRLVMARGCWRVKGQAGSGFTNGLRGERVVELVPRMARACLDMLPGDRRGDLPTLSQVSGFDGHAGTSSPVLELGTRRSFCPSLGTVGRKEGVRMHGDRLMWQRGV
eukprot:13770740-Alexandrium_andersonii.AAC.1